MPRPCSCERVRIGSEYSRDQCRWCWLFHHRADYREFWSSQREASPKSQSHPGESRQAVPPESRKCVHRGEQASEVECRTCGGSVRIKVFECSVFEKCTVGRQVESIACCASCERFEPRD